MKKLLYLIMFTLSISLPGLAQDDAEEQGGSALREKMIEYIQKKLDLSKGEAEKFEPVFVDYLRNVRETKREHRADKLVLQQKIAELRLRYRDQFKPIMGEKRSNEVFNHEREFVQKVLQEQRERLQNRQDGRANKRSNSLLH